MTSLILLAACAFEILIALLLAALFVFRSHQRSLKAKLVLSVGFLLCFVSCALPIVTPPDSWRLYRYFVASHITGTWAGLVLISVGLALDSLLFGQLLQALVGLVSVALSVAHCGIWLFLGAKGLLLSSAPAVNQQSTMFAEHSQAILHTDERPEGWADSILDVSLATSVATAAALFITALPLLYGLGTFAARRAGRFRLQGFLLLLLGSALFIQAELFPNRRYLAKAHVALIGSSTVAFALGELAPVRGLLGALFELAATAALWAYPAISAIGAWTGVRFGAFSRANKESQGTATNDPQVQQLLANLYQIAIAASLLTYVVATLLALRRPRSVHPVAAHKKTT